MKNKIINKDCYTVYMHVTPNNKRYVGITSKNPLKRWKSGRGYSRNKHFKGAIARYGWDNIKHIILYENLSKELACQVEIDLIMLFDSTNPMKGYNQSNGGEVNSGYHFSEEAKKKMSDSNKGDKNPMYGKHHSDETKKKISNSNKGDKNPMYGKHHSEETCKKMSDSHKGDKNPMYGKHPSEETCKKMSDSLSKPLILFDYQTNKKLGTFKSVREVKEYTGSSIPLIRRCAYGICNSFHKKQYYVRYA